MQSKTEPLTNKQINEQLFTPINHFALIINFVFPKDGHKIRAKQYGVIFILT